MSGYRYKFMRKALNKTIKLKKSIIEINELGSVKLFELINGTQNPSRHNDHIEKLDEFIKFCHVVLNNPKRFKK